MSLCAGLSWTASPNPGADEVSVGARRTWIRWRLRRLVTGATSSSSQLAAPGCQEVGENEMGEEGPTQDSSQDARTLV